MSKPKHPKTPHDDHAPIYQAPPQMNPKEPQSNNPRPVQASFTGPNSQQPTANSRLSDEFNLFDYLRVIYKYKWMIMVITVVAMAATVAYSLSQPRMYQASTSIVPPIDRLSQGGGLASKLGGAGSVLLQGMLNQGDLSGLYVGLLESRKVSEALVKEFDLMTVYQNVETRTDARRILKNNTRIQVSKEGIVHITVKDLDATRAAEIANAYRNQLDIQNRLLSGGQATSKRVFLENRLKEIQAELSKIDSLQSREVQVKEALFELLSNECEMAKIEEAKSMPTIQVLDQAVVPERPIGRAVVKKAKLAFSAAFLASILLAVAIDRIQKYRYKHICHMA